jgi:hypothetical protein
MFGYLLIAFLTGILIVVMVKRALGHYEPLAVTRRKAWGSLQEELRQRVMRHMPLHVRRQFYVVEQSDALQAAPTWDDVRNPEARVAFHSIKTMWDH